VGSQSEVAFGLDENIAAALSYIITFLVPVLLLVKEEDNEFVRFHAAQSIVFTVALVVGMVGINILTMFLSFIPVVGGILGLVVGLLVNVVYLGAMLGFLFLAYKAYNGEHYVLPVIGQYADELL
jgi:uncharacterized membrane protein